MKRREWRVTARVLSEALPYLQRYDGKTVVVKLGGNAMSDEDSMNFFARDIVLMKQCGVRPVVVHGGGPMIDEMLKRLAIESEFKNGLRVTTPETVEVVEMVLAGVINKRIVAAINNQGGRAVGLSGKDANLLICEKTVKIQRDPDSNIERALDLGLVGEPVEVNPEVLTTVIDGNLIPVVAPVGTGKTPGKTFNINGDTAAGAIAGAMRAERLMLLTDVEGIKNAKGEVESRILPDRIADMKADGTVTGGMIPKVDTVLAAIAQGVKGAVILDGRVPHAVLLELFTEHGAGTLIQP